MVKKEMIKQFIDTISKIFKLLYGNILTIIFYLCSIIAFYLGVVGGKYFLIVAFIVGSFNSIYAIYFYAKKKRRKYKLNDFIKSEEYLPYKKIQKRIFKLEIIIVVFGILLLPLYVFVGNYIILDKNQEIQDIINGLIDDSMNETEKVDALLTWFNRRDNAPDNFSSMYHRRQDKQILLHFFNMFFVYDEEPHFCVRGSVTPDWTITSRCGMCGEQAVLFKEMGTIAGLNVSSVHCIPEDHAWNEIYIEDGEEPVIVDATAVKLPNSTGIKTPEFMQQKILGDWKKLKEYPKEGNVSFVYCKFPNDSNNYNVTKRYTNITNITVNVTDLNGNSISDVSVKVISYNRPNVDRRSCWGLEKTTNELGKCTFSLGGGRYKFELKHKDDWFPFTTDLEKFWEDEKHQYYPIIYKSQTIVTILIKNPTYIIIILLICLWIIVIYIERKKKSKKK